MKSKEQEIQLKKTKKEKTKHKGFGQKKPIKREKHEKQGKKTRQGIHLKKQMKKLEKQENKERY